MDWKSYAPLFASAITTLLAFILNKYLYNKPKLIAYYGHVSAHKIPLDKGYPLNLLQMNELPAKEFLDANFKNKIPLIIRVKENIWLYGLNTDGNTILTQSLHPQVYNELQMIEQLTCINEAVPEIYRDINFIGGHISSMNVHTHAVVVRNTGKLPTKNVRLGHNFLPNHNIFPNIKYELTNLPNGGKEISFPILVPNEQITISYLYFAPTVYTDINTHVMSDDGLAKVISVIPSPNLSTKIKNMLYILIFIGATTLIYFILVLLNCMLHCFFH
ncbi:hypothetical protein SC738_04275 [Legionella pneumophila serogroup 1]|uniref:hypothetical protein n=1 Tax=Legionella pneumophila TaxID=446 RepID=UPI001A23670D|nr:hypothetical protein [Legionella pneumophila]MCH9154478.1 hypothetical protein [Legionella pneumophila serogroup 1]HAT4697482.1 hypothetical protein [Legionella pneumophila]HAT4725496.1 hypothetical protein [Legionella pneumophila]HAT9021792.1 hypothetical protein [Legionella pneumophila subsp. pneumophila]